MAATVRELHCMKVHVFESEESHARAREQGLIGPEDLVLTPDRGLIDSELSDTSANPVENRAVKRYIDQAIANALAGLKDQGGET